MIKKCDQCQGSISFDESDMKDNEMMILNTLKNTSNSSQVSGSHAHNLIGAISDDYDGLVMPPLCIKCSVAAYDELNRQLAELEDEGNVYEDALRELEERAIECPYDSTSNKKEIAELDDELKALEEEIALLNTVEGELLSSIKELDKNQAEADMEF